MQERTNLEKQLYFYRLVQQNINLPHYKQYNLKNVTSLIKEIETKLKNN